jgi:Lon-like protease
VSRRVRTLLVAGVLFLVLFVLALLMPVPYVVLSPGPTLNTLGTDSDGRPIITIKGRQSNQTTGHLNLTTIDIRSQRVTSVEALVGWLQHDRAVVPRSVVYPPGQSEKQVNEQDAAQFASSQDFATAAAFCELGYPKGFGVLAVEANSGADGKLQPFDQLISLDGAPIDSQQKLSTAMANRKPGETVMIAFKRAGKPMTASVKLSQPEQGQQGAVIGITVGDQCFAPFEVNLGLGGQIGGPSAGLMFALGIMDKVGNRDLTKGAFIAGTGEIGPDGRVKPIGGIQLKMLAARRQGATIFLAPQDNCGDVRGATPGGLNVIKVASLHAAVQDLLAVQSGQSVPHC